MAIGQRQRTTREHLAWLRGLSPEERAAYDAEQAEKARPKPPQERGTLEPLPGRCGAKIRNTDPQKYCASWPRQGRDRCRLHGGNMPRGIDHGNYRHKGYSKDLPTRLFDRFLLALDDPELASLANENAVLVARLGELMERLETGENEDAWAEIRGCVKETLRQLDAGKPEEARTALESALSVIEDAQGEYKVWREIRSTMEMRRKLTDTERKREEFLAERFDRRQLLAFMGRLQMILLEEIPDHEQRQRIAARIAAEGSRGQPVATIHGNQIRALPDGDEEEQDA